MNQPTTDIINAFDDLVGALMYKSAQIQSHTQAVAAGAAFPDVKQMSRIIAEMADKARDLSALITKAAAEHKSVANGAATGTMQ